MNSKEQICYKVEALARKILTSYFCDSDVECLINTLAPDVLWLGGGKNMRARGREAVAAAFRNAGEMIAYDLTEEHYDTMDMGGRYLSVPGDWLDHQQAGTADVCALSPALHFHFSRNVSWAGNNLCP